MNIRDLLGHLRSVTQPGSYMFQEIPREIFLTSLEARADELEKTLQKERAEHKVPGVNVEAVWALGYGVFQ